MWRFCNDDRSFIKKGGRKAPKISAEEFKKKLIHHVLDKTEVTEQLEYDYSKEQIARWKNNEEIPLKALCEIFVYFGYYIGENESYQISKDLSKINGMDFENVCVATEETINEANACVEGDLGNSQLLGFKTLKNGLPIYGMAVGLDGVYPVYFCIYWDGKKFRGYIPTYGNFFNKIDRCVMGYHESEYEEYLDECGQKGSTIPDMEYLRNDEAMEEDRCSRIVII